MSCEINTKQTWKNILMLKFHEVFGEICHAAPLVMLQFSSPTSSFYFQLSDSLFFFISDETLSAFQD